jgi:hypothetical protein
LISEAGAAGFIRISLSCRLGMTAALLQFFVRDRVPNLFPFETTTPMKVSPGFEEFFTEAASTLYSRGRCGLL